MLQMHAEQKLKILKARSQVV